MVYVIFFLLNDSLTDARKKSGVRRIYDKTYNSSESRRLVLPCDGLYYALASAGGVVSSAIVEMAGGIPRIINSNDKTIIFKIASASPTDIYLSFDFASTSITSANIEVIQMVNAVINYYYYGQY